MGPLVRSLAAWALCLAVWALGGAGTARAQAAPAQNPAALTVILDDNYPPYVFRDDAGALQGILPDLWQLWGRKTGIPVRLLALDWGEAQRRFQAGEGDVIDTIFRTPKRDEIYRFSAPYATIEVPLLFSAELSGIRDAATARGFAIGVKDGDACIDVLAAQGTVTLQRYASFESLVEGAGRREVKVFCMDKPPAAYFLAKKGLDSQFRASEPLYSGQFHWAVRKDAAELYAQVQAGFTLIGAAERRAIDDKWMGAVLRRFDDGVLWRNVMVAVGVLAAAAAVLALWVWSLRKQVAARTIELRRALKELGISETRFRTIFDDVNDAIFIHDAETGAILLVNRRMEEMYGYDPGEALHLTIGELSEGVAPYGVEEAREWCLRSAAEPQLFEWHARRKDGSLFWVEVAIRRAAIGEEGERLLVVVRDISERKRAEEALQEKNRALERSNAELEAFAYVASHDLREPLRNVTAFSELLGRKLAGRLDDEEQDLLKILGDAASRMDSLVRDLLEVSRVGRAEQHFAPVQVAETVAAAQAALKLQMEDAGAVLSLPPELPMVMGNSEELYRVFMNVFGNSLKYRRPDAAPFIALTCRSEGECWRFEIADNGIGIEAGQGYEERIFGLFQRLHQRHEHGGGTGIGLPICRKIVHRHGGRMWAESAGPGLGTTILFTLPKMAG